MPQEQNIPYGYCHCGCGKQTTIIHETNMSRGHIKGEPHKYLLGHGRYKEKVFLPVGVCICRNRECSIPFGLCHCGCGGKTRISRADDRFHGYVRKYPVPYIRFHGNPASPRREEAQPFKIDGVYCRVVELSQGQWSIVNEEDYERVTEHRWHAQWNPKLKRFYATTNVRVGKNTTRQMPMHRFIMGLGFGDDREVDHKDRLQTLDNRRANLRIVTSAQNRMNSKIWSNNKCGVKGVLWSKQKQKWQAYIVVNGKQMHLGFHGSIEEASKARAEGVVKYHGEFGRHDESCISIDF